MKKILNYLKFVFGLFLSVNSALAQEEMFFDEPRVVTAAKKEQVISEAPAIVTVITAKEIKQMGARNLMDVLRVVPGFNILQDTNEHLAVIRGIYASANQKILILRDGHRLNDWVFNAAEPDYSLSLANVKRIEIIRGPGASLYGSAALTAVINIITEDGKDIDGLKVHLAGGNFDQQKIDLVFGKDYERNRDLVLYASFYRTAGEKADIEKAGDSAKNPIDGNEYVDKRDLNYDFGLKLKEGKFLFSASFQNSNYFNPRGNSGQLIDWNQHQVTDYYQLFRTSHVDFSWEDKVGENLRVKLRHYFDHIYWFSWQLIEPERDYAPYGKMFSWDVDGASYGGEYSLSYPIGKGDILIGFQPEGRNLYGSNASRNYGNPEVSAINAELEKKLIVKQLDSPIKIGGEYYLAGYLQIDQNFNDFLKLNLGIRYDHYKDVGGSANPRAALILQPYADLYWKVLYGRSFLNPSYFYRHVTGVMGYYGGPDLKPEVMDSYQTLISKNFGKNHVLKLAYFYNSLKDLVAQDKSVPGRFTYKNYGRTTINGIEAEGKTMPMEQMEFFANWTWQKPVKSRTDASQIKDGALIGIPAHSANIGMNYRITDDFNTNLTANWHGKIESPAILKSGGFGPDYEIPAETILNTAIILDRIWGNTELSLKIHNLLDTKYNMGGTTIPYRQPGRWFLIGFASKF